MTPEEQFAALGLYRDESGLVTRDELIAQTMVGTMEGIVKAFSARPPESTTTLGEVISFLEGSIEDIKALYPGVTW
jgi:hypothetical protein